MLIDYKRERERERERIVSITHFLLFGGPLVVLCDRGLPC